MPDPKLRIAMEEIKRVLKKHDIVADVLLASPTHIEYLREFKASWSCCWLEPGGLLRVRCKRKDFPSDESHLNALNATVGTLAGFADAARNEAEQLTNVLKQLHISFEHITKDEGPT